MNKNSELSSTPESYDLFVALRLLEKQNSTQPRIGDSAVANEDVVQLFQDPFLDFPSTNVASFEAIEDGPDRLGSKFLGFFGPQGALPVTTTVEAQAWLKAGDRAYSDFANIFANRYIQLFFRAWSDSRAITQADREDADQFRLYLGSFLGIGTATFADHDSLPDVSKLPYAGLLGSQVKSAQRLVRFLRDLFKVKVAIEERVQSWLIFEPEDQMSIGSNGCALGVDAFIGQRVSTINEKIVLCLELDSLDQYERYLPQGDLCKKMVDAVFFYLGHRYEFELELALPAKLAPGVCLGKSGQLGWSSWLQFSAAGENDTLLKDARISPLHDHLASAAVEN